MKKEWERQKKSLSEELYGKVKKKPTYEGEVKITKTKKTKKDKITIGDIIRSVTGRGSIGKYHKEIGLNKGGRATHGYGKAYLKGGRVK